MRRLIFALLLFSSAVLSETSEPTRDRAADQVLSKLAPLTVNGTESGLLITPYAQVIEDRNGTVDLSQAIESDQWQRSLSNALALGYSKSSWWVRWRIENVSDRSIHGVMDLGHPCQDYAHWFVLRGGARDIETSRSGDRLPYSERALPYRNLATSLQIAPHESIDVYLRLQSFDGLFEPLAIKYYDHDAFVKANDTETFFSTLYYGGLLALALYNLLLFAATRERSFGAYVLYTLSFLAWNFTFRGFSLQYLWPDSPAFNNDFLTAGVAWTFGTIGLFAIVSLRMRETVPRWLYRLNLSLVVINLATTVVAFTGSYAVGAAVSQTAGLILTIVTQGTAVWLLRKGSREARFFVIAFALITVGVGAYILQIIAVLPTNWFTTWGVQIGSALEILLLALGLADSMNTLKAQKLKAEQQAREMQEALNVQLTKQVSERTEELAIANRRLHELAITDELTGAFNRRHFTAFCSAALAHRDHGRPSAFCMFHLDHFKAFNEHRGHQASDEVLRSVAQAVNVQLQRTGDVLFRLGSEEFGVLFTASSPEAAREFAERLRKCVRDLQIAHPHTADGVLTVSFGVGWWGSGVMYRLTPDQMYAVADNMLYEAKEVGGDCVKLEARFATGAHKALQPHIPANRAEIGE